MAFQVLLVVTRLYHLFQFRLCRHQWLALIFAEAEIVSDLLTSAVFDTVAELFRHRDHILQRSPVLWSEIVQRFIDGLSNLLFGYLENLTELLFWNLRAVLRVHASFRAVNGAVDEAFDVAVLAAEALAQILWLAGDGVHRAPATVDTTLADLLHIRRTFLRLLTRTLTDLALCRCYEKERTNDHHKGNSIHFA